MKYFIRAQPPAPDGAGVFLCGAGSAGDGFGICTALSRDYYSKKGGTFAIHDIMSNSKYGDMESFVKKLKDMGYEEVKLVDTTNGMFMSKWESTWMTLSGSAILMGRK